MKYNFSRAFTLLTFVFFVISLKAQDSLSVDSVSALTAVNNISADTLVDSSAVKSDTLLTLTEIIHDTSLVKNEQSDSIPPVITEIAAEPETTAVTQAALPAEPPAAAVLEEVSQTIPETIVNFDETVKQFFAENKALRWIKTHLLYLIFFFCSVIVIIMAVLFFSTKKDGRRFLTTTRLSVLDKMVQKGCRYIESNYMDSNLMVETVCSELVTGAAYLNALFIKEIGIDVQSFIIQVRVNSIKNLLAESPPASDLGKICEQCGFKTSAEAREHFVKLCGVGIEEYRNSLAAEPPL
ncbi:MAG: AraC family transcriptional regulator [Chitinispirillales bacterium]|jgi:AraC-like DNA-binding protein|nr:AraC family transcriptional regulator [Chitinispirillales bacterium]